jgi:hypothetical protein
MNYAAESIGAARALQLFGSSFFGNGANLSGIVSFKNPMTIEGMAEAESRFRKLYSGARNNNKIGFLDKEATFTPLTVTPEAAQSVEAQQHMVAEICRWFGVPPHKVQHLLNATFSNIEHQAIEVVQDSIMPWSTRFCDEVDRKLLGNNREGFYSHMDFAQILRGDTATRLAYYRGIHEMGAYNVDEIRGFEGESPIGKTKGGDKYVMQGQYVPLEKLGEIPPKPDPVVPVSPEPVTKAKPVKPVTVVNKINLDNSELRGQIAAVCKEIQDTAAKMSTVVVAVSEHDERLANLAVAVQDRPEVIKGEPGVSMIGAVLEGDNELVVDLSDGTRLNAGKIKTSQRRRARKKQDV